MVTDGLPALAREPAPGGPPTGEPMGPPEPTWPMSVKDFLSGPYLEPADILIMRQRSNWFARAVRLLTGSFFSKAALVFFVPHHEADFAKPFLIEATFKGIDLTDLESFCNRKDKTYVIAVKRVEAPWFEQEERNLVRGFLINHVKAGYDYGLLFDRFWESIGRSQFVVLRVLFGPHWALRQLTRQRDPVKLNRFIGPGLIQWGYYQAAHSLRDLGLIGPAEVDEVIFRNGIAVDPASGVLSPEDRLSILAVTAEDFAKSPRLAWKYAILDGDVHRIASEQDFYKLVAASKQRWLDGANKQARART